MKHILILLEKYLPLFTPRTTIVKSGKFDLMSKGQYNYRLKKPRNHGYLPDYFESVEKIITSTLHKIELSHKEKSIYDRS